MIRFSTLRQLPLSLAALAFLVFTALSPAQAALRGSPVASASTGTTQTVTVTPIGIQLGDIVLLSLTNFMGNTPSFPAGFAQVPGTSPAVNDGNISVAVFYKVATSTEVAASTLAVTGTNFGGALTCRVYSGRNTSSPFTTQNQTVHVTVAAFPVTFSITGLTAGAGDDVVVFEGEQTSGGSTAAVLGYAPSSGFANGGVANSSVAGDSHWTTSSDLVNTSGATGTIAGIISITSGIPGQTGYLAQVISMAPTGGGGTRKPTIMLMGIGASLRSPSPQFHDIDPIDFRRWIRTTANESVYQATA